MEKLQLWHQQKMDQEYLQLRQLILLDSQLKQLRFKFQDMKMLRRFQQERNYKWLQGFIQIM